MNSCSRPSTASRSPARVPPLRDVDVDCVDFADFVDFDAGLDDEFDLDDEADLAADRVGDELRAFAPRVAIDHQRTKGVHHGWSISTSKVGQ